mmetsp:Transcript_24126/g.54890  ORF Transcript_24126/g.54890 Transcript_24126/m.54890 type:complete len:139 (-) Transcript_24126:283-699(-)
MQGGMEQVVLELDEQDKKSLQELQQSVGQAEKELQMVAGKLRQKEIDGKRAALTAAELDEVADETPAYVQVGKMFLLEPLADIKSSLAKRAEESAKDVATLKDKQTHMKETYEKCNAEFTEFVKAHVAEPKSEEADAK